jgi:hypothetical protein
MNRLLAFAIVVVFALTAFSPPTADAAGARGGRRAPHRRSIVVVRPGHPIRRAMHPVVFRRPAVVVRVAPVRFLPLVVWAPAVVTRPAVESFSWQDSETLSKEEGWAETVFDSNQRGRKLYLEVLSGKVQLDFAEVVFENGDTQVVDFSEKTRDPGFYSLLDFADGRRVDHVRLIACAKSKESRIVLVMEK